MTGTILVIAWAASVLYIAYLLGSTYGSRDRGFTDEEVQTAIEEAFRAGFRSGCLATETDFATSLHLAAQRVAGRERRQ